MKLVDATTFERDGGLTIGIGAKNCLYTLRNEWNEQRQAQVGDGMPASVYSVRCSSHLQNLGKDWAEVAARLPEVLRERGHSEDAGIYVPGHCDGKLDPNKSPDPKYIPNENSPDPFRKHPGLTVADLRANDPEYLFFLLEGYNPREETQHGRWLAMARDVLKDELAGRTAVKEAARVEQAKQVENDKARLGPLAEFLAKRSTRPGDFASSIAEDLRRGVALEDMPERAVSITREMWAKSFGSPRRSSDKYETAAEDFDRKFFRAPEPIPSVTENVGGVMELAEPQVEERKALVISVNQAPEVSV